jgi:hypothetical protein
MKAKIILMVMMLFVALSAHSGLKALTISNVSENYREIPADELKTSMVAPYGHLPKELPKPGLGLQIKSLKELDKDACKHYLKSKKSLVDSKTDKNLTDEIKFIIDTVNLVNVDLSVYELNLDLGNTELKKTVKQVPINFKYKQLSQTDRLQTVGFAPTGLQTSQGWNGVSEFFKVRRC